MLEAISVEVFENSSIGFLIVKFTPEKPSLFGETLESLQTQVEAAGFPKFRAKQVMEWLYKKRVDEWGAMSNLPKVFRAWLDEHYVLFPTTSVIDKRSNDVTQKLLLELEDKSLIETVLISAPQTGVGQEHSRKTVCVSIQVGCAYGCKFCASGLAGFRRNLVTAEVVSQLMHICRREDAYTKRAKAEIASFDNIVFMGMGEPLANYDTLVQTIRILNADWGLNFGARRITVSTSGLAPEIEKLANENLSVRLAISLHGATNEVRDQIMPINKRYPLEVLIPAARAFQQKNGRMLTLEFILIDGVNDDLVQAEHLAEIARDLHAHVNCIPYNKVEGLEWERPNVRRQDAFVDVLRAKGVSVTIRREKGHDIDAACGQLRLKTERTLSAPLPVASPMKAETTL
ncbi:MAG: 23S rRNA (adenine2503-C2)-methyltransferase [Lentimonas sp.]